MCFPTGQVLKMYFKNFAEKAFFLFFLVFKVQNFKIKNFQKVYNRRFSLQPFKYFARNNNKFRNIYYIYFYLFL